MTSSVNALALLLLLSAAPVPSSGTEDLCAEKTARWKLQAALSDAEYPDLCASWRFARTEAEKSDLPGLLKKIPVCDTEEQWGRFRAAVLRLLRSDPGNPAALRAARTLRSSGVRFVGRDVSLDAGPNTVAQYDGMRNVIEIDFSYFKAHWTRRFPQLPTDEDLRATAEALSPWIVHELAHARIHSQMGGKLWIRYLEDELVPYAEHADFLMSRLRREPGLLRMPCIDEQLTGRLGSTWTARGWEFVPFKTADVPRGKALIADIRTHCGADTTGTNSLFLIRSFAGGFPLLADNLSAAKDFNVAGEPLLVPPPEHVLHAREGIEERIRALEACRPAARAGGLERGLEEDLAALAAKRAFYVSEAPFEELRRRQREAIGALGEDLRRLKGAKP